MLSSVSKLADKNFVIGFFLPALLGVLVLANMFQCPPWMATICSTASSSNQFADLTYLALVVWLVAVVLMILNYPEYRLLEGYIPPISWLSSLRKRHRRHFLKLTKDYERLKDAAELSGDKSKSSRARRTLLSSYPPRESDILPTAFGNRLRAFEFYPSEVYGVDSISVWLRLGAVIPKDFQALINDARAQVDFLVNSTFIAFVLGICALVRAVAAAFQSSSLSLSPASFLGIAALCFAASYVFYLWATERATAWGDLVKSAFDCYLPTLAKQLGYSLPPLESKRRLFWTDFSRLALYRDKMVDGKWQLANPTDTSAVDGTRVPSAARVDDSTLLTPNDEESV